MSTFPETLGFGQIISRELKEEIERRYNTYIVLEKQLAEREKQIVDARSVIAEMVDLMEGVREGDYDPDSFTCQPANAFLAATQDLSGCILCDAKPAMRVEKNASSQIRAVDGDGNAFDLLTNVGVTFYKAKD
jgi:hypothetical protein